MAGGRGVGEGFPIGGSACFAGDGIAGALGILNAASSIGTLASIVSTVIFARTLGLFLGPLSIEYGYMMQAHTDGDIYVHFPKQNVLVVGDVLSVGQYPTLDYVTGGWLGGFDS